MSPDQLLYVGKEFKTFEELETCLKAYEQKTCTYFVKSTSKKVSSVNVLVLARGGDPYPQELVYSNLVYTCKRGGRKRIKTGQGNREFQS
jgi:hypothetical protein